MNNAYRCPDPAHGETDVPMKANNDRVYECPSLHKYWRREEEGKIVLVNLITQQRFEAAEIPATGAADQPERPRLNFMVDVPFAATGVDFNALSLTVQQWKLFSRIDGKANLEEVRLLAGLNPQDAERLVHELVDIGLIEVRRRGGR
jgi:hypothetical protein